MPQRKKTEPKAPSAKKAKDKPPVAPVSLSRLRANPRRGGRGR